MHHVPIDAELDLHAFAPRDIPSVVEEYVTAAAAAGLAEVRLVHGRGRGCNEESCRPRSIVIRSSKRSGTMPPRTLARQSLA
jgi:hypothetical protein